MTTSSAITDHRYVLFTTFRRDGRGVGTAVWIAPLGSNQGCFTTGGDSGKVKRLSHTPRVTVQACDVRGRPHTNAPIVQATAIFVEGIACQPVNEAMTRKYKIQFRLLTLSGTLAALMRRRRVADAGVIMTFI